MDKYILKTRTGSKVQTNAIVNYNANTTGNFDIKRVIAGGEDGKVAIFDPNTFACLEYLPDAVDRNGWLIEIDDIHIINANNILIVSSAGVIAEYHRESNIWQYKIILESSECYYSILDYNAKRNSIKVMTEFSGEVEIALA